MINSTSGSQGFPFTVTPKVVDFLEVFTGEQFNTVQVERINKGELDLLIGLVVTQNYLQGSEGPTQVLIRTPDGENFTLTNNENVKLNPAIFDLLTNTYLINRPRVIWIKNLNYYRVQFQEAAKYGQMVACAYDRITGEIILLSIQSNQDLLTPRQTQNSETAIFSSWPPHSKP